MLSATVQNLVTPVTRHLEFLHPWFSLYVLKSFCVYVDVFYTLFLAYNSMFYWFFYSES